MITRSSAEIRQNYNEIADICHKTSQPVILINDGEEDLVIMDFKSYRQDKMLKLRRELEEVEEARKRGSKGYSVEEVDAMLKKVIEEA